MKGQPHDHKHLMPTQIIPGSGKTSCEQARCVFLPGLSVKRGHSSFLKLLICHLEICKLCQIIASDSGQLNSEGRR